MLGVPLDAGATNSIAVTDNNGPALTVTLAAKLIPESGATTGTVTRNTAPTSDLSVSLSSSVPNAASVPASVIIPNGETSASFPVTGVNPGFPTGTRTVDITAAAGGYGTGVGSLDVSDINLPDLVVSGFSLPAAGLSGSNVTVTYTVSNVGIAPTIGSWLDNVWYSLAPDGSNPKQIGQFFFNKGPLGVGQSYSNSASFNLPFNVGPIYIVVTTDIANTANESSFFNNTAISTNTISVSPYYSATVQADLHQAVSPTPIPMHGHAFLTSNPAQPAANVPVTIRILTKGTRRTYDVNADQNGNFTFTFQPIPSEAGLYVVGADYPYVPQDPAQDQFDLYGMRITDQQISLTATPATNFSGASTLINLGDQPLTGLTAAVYGLPPGISVDAAVTNQMAGGANADLVYSVTTSAFTQPLSGRAYIQVNSDQGAVAYLPLFLTLTPPEPLLAAVPGNLETPMLVGQQTFVDFDIQNIGGAATGPIQMQLPSAPWLGTLNSTNMPSLNPGESNRVTIALTPDAALALQFYNGNIFFGSANSSLIVPFSFRAISSATGNLQVTVQDEYTFYVAGAPNVTNATVTLFDPYSGDAIATNLTDAVTGVAMFTNIPAGTYNISVSAPKHDGFKSSTTIRPGQTAQMTPFISRQTVTIDWTVVPTTVEDTYQVVLQSDFETEVPIPVVTIDNPTIIPLMIENEDTVVHFEVSNHGLIAAEQVNIEVPDDDPDYIYKPLVNYMQEIPAMSTIDLPMVISWRSNSPTLMKMSQAPHGPGKTDFLKFDCQPLPNISVKWGIYCGNDFHWHTIPQELIMTPVEHDCFDSLKKKIQEGIDDPGAVAEALTSLAETAEKNLAKAFGSAGCSLLDTLAECPPLASRPCLTTILKITCGVATEDVKGAITAALHFGECWCPDSPPQLPQLNLTTSGGGRPPAPDGCLLCFSSGGGSGGSSGGGGGPGCWLCDWQPPVWDWPTCIPGMHIGDTTQLLAVHKNDAPPTTSAGDVCAHVRIEIDQQVTITRSAFKGTLNVDNNDPTNALTSVQITLAITDDSGAPATNLFGIVTSGLTGIGAVDGTGTIAPSATGTAVFTFTPTHDAAPVAMKHYKIGGTLTYVQNGTTVSTELLPQDIYVYPDPLLNLDYFLQRDVIADDPNQPGTIQPQPFYLGLMVNNKGYGKALNFTVTSAQPKIVENSKGLLINFQLTGASVGANPISPSLTANFGEIDPMTTTVGTWQMTCTLAGKFIDYSATFQHVNELGNPQTSIIDSVNIHEMIHVIKDVRPGQDDVPDFLVNDVPDSGHLPDTVYLSDGTTNSVAIITGGSSDGPITPTHMQAVVTAPMTAGWGYAVVPDPGPGYRLYRAVRSDGLDMKAPFNVWTTPLSFPASQTGAVHENLAHIVDFGGPGSYNLYYHTTNTVAPTIVQMSGPATFVQSGPISSAQIVFSEPIDLSTFDYHALNLSLNGGANLITSNVTVTPTSGSTYAINNLFALTGAAGNYTLTFNGAAVQDAGGNNIAGPTTAAVSWANGNAPVVVQSIDAVTPNTRNTPVTALNVTFDKPLNAATFDYHDLTLTQNGTNVALTSVTITPVTAAMFQISGLAPLTGSDGNYVLTVNATGVEDTGNAPGAGSLSVSWTLLTVGPTIVNTQYVQSPRNIVVQALDVTFSHAIDPATFDYHDINLTFNGGPNLITPVVTVTPISPTVYEIRNFNWVSGNDGAYSLTVDAGGIADLAGNAGTGTANVAWQMSTHIPDPPFNFAISPDTGVYAHDGVTASNSVTLSGAINGANLTVHVNDQTTGQNYGMIATTNGAFYLPLTLTKGAHYLQLYTVDAAANTSSNVYYDIFLDNSALSAVVDAVTPNPRTTPVTNLNITFSEPIDTNTFHLTNITVTLNGSNTLTPTLTMVSSNVFRVGGLAPLTAGVGAYQVAVNLNGVIDQAGVGGSNLVTQSWARTLSATNIPVIAAIPNHTIAAKTTLRVTPLVTDPAVPPLVLTYSLLPGAPTGATIDPATGAFQWTPTPAQANTTNQITIKVADNGNPQQTATQSFTVVVQNNLQLLIGSAIVYGGSSSNVAIGLNAETTLTNLTFLVTVPTNLFSSLALQANTPQLAAASILPAGSNIWQVKLAANPGQTFGAMPQMAFLNFTASNQSAIVPLSAQAMQPANADGSTPTNIVAEAGRIVIVGSTPLIEALTFGPATNHQRSLTLYGFPGSSYAIQSSPDLVHWTDAFRVPLTNMTEVLTNLNNKLGSLFLRADQFVTVAPVVDIMKTTVNNAEQLVLYGAPGAAYEVDYSVGLGAPWNLLMRIPMTNAFQFVSGLSAANQTLFYRFNLLNAEPPILDANLSDGGRSLIAYGRPGTNYILQFATNLAGRAAWQDWTNFSSTNAFQSFTNLGGAAPTIFYRLERH
ncbi:MAG TPA: CARDB domain-containing protein [Verrucomicrobiae bacterium]|nr:CARDB domain-containing protein [Verrucomicrobiae bacterium]